MGMCIYIYFFNIYKGLLFSNFQGLRTVKHTHTHLFLELKIFWRYYIFLLEEGQIFSLLIRFPNLPKRNP